MQILMGLGILGVLILASVFVYWMVRLGTAAYFRSKLEYETKRGLNVFKHTFGFDRRKIAREVQREAEK